jgi:hypothetical protein
MRKGMLIATLLGISRVTYDPAHTTPERMVKAIENAGYKAHVENEPTNR